MQGTFQNLLKEWQTRYPLLPWVLIMIYNIWPSVIMPNVTSIGTDPIDDPARLQRKADEGVNIRGDPSISRDVDTSVATIESIEIEADIVFPEKLHNLQVL